MIYINSETSTNENMKYYYKYLVNINLFIADNHKANKNNNSLNYDCNDFEG